MHDSGIIDQVELYGMTRAELLKLISTNSEVKALRYYEYKISEALYRKDCDKAKQAFNCLKFIIDGLLFPEPYQH